MERFKVILNRGNSYWEPLTKTNLTQTQNWRVFTDEMIKRLDLSGINYSLQIGTLKKIELNPEPEVEETAETTEEVVEEEVTEEPQEEVAVEVTVEEVPAEEEEEEEELVLVDELDNGKVRCQELKSDGTQCVYEAKYPEEDPQFCGIHNHE